MVRSDEELVESRDSNHDLEEFGLDALMIVSVLERKFLRSVGKHELVSMYCCSC